MLSYECISGCEDCQLSKPDECELHPVFTVADNEIPSYARLTLPPSFTITQTVTGQNTVICKKNVKARSRFGPLIGKRIKPSDLNNQQPPPGFKVSRS